MRAGIIRTIVLCTLTTSAAGAAELWVDVDSKGGTCDDGRARGAVTKTEPWCSLKAAANAVEPGDVVNVRGGKYTEPHTCPSCDDNSVLQIVRPGTAAAPIRFVAQAGESVELAPGGSGVVHGLTIKKIAAFTEVRGFRISVLSRR